LIPSIEAVARKFNSLLGGKLLVCVNEADSTETKDSKIKHFITASNWRKHKDAIQS